VENVLLTQDFTSLQYENKKPVSRLLPVQFVSPQFICIVVLQHKSEWMGFLTELIQTDRSVTRLHGARVKMQVWCPHFRTWGLPEANVLYWIMYVWHCWDLFASSQSFGAPQYFSTPRMIRRPGNCAPLPLRYAPADWNIMQCVKSYRCLL